MGAALHGLARDFFIGQSAEDQDQGVGRSLEHLVERIEALAVGQRQVKQDHLEAFPAQSFERIGESRHPFDTKRAASRARKRILDQPGIGGIVFDEKDSGRGHVHGMAVCGDGPRSSYRRQGGAPIPSRHGRGLSRNQADALCLQ